MSENPFIDWVGGNCPVDQHALVEYKMRSSPEDVHESVAMFLEWRREQTYPMRDWDIVAYRVKQTGDKHECK